jgi:Ca2+-transporting ATPase
MRRPPRDPNEPILTRRSWIEMAGFSALITMAVLGALALAYLGLGMQQGRAVKISFLTLAFAQLWHVFNMRDQGSSFLDNKVVRNRWIWGALALCTALLLAAVYVPGLNTLLRVEDPGLHGWGLVLGASLLPWLAGQVFRSWKTRLNGCSNNGRAGDKPRILIEGE